MKDDNDRCDEPLVVGGDPLMPDELRPLAARPALGKRFLKTELSSPSGGSVTCLPNQTGTYRSISENPNFTNLPKPVPAEFVVGDRVLVKTYKLSGDEPVKQTGVVIRVNPGHCIVKLEQREQVYGTYQFMAVEFYNLTRLPPVPPGGFRKVNNTSCFEVEVTHTPKPPPSLATCCEVAARIWCDPAYRDQVMDTDLCEIIARLLHRAARR